MAKFIAITIVMILLMNILSSCSGYTERHGPPQKPVIKPFQHYQSDKRHIADAVLDPYSVLGFLSFATFLFSVLYNRQKMKPMKSGNDGGNPTGPPMLHNSLDLPKILTLILNATDKNMKIPIPGKADTLDQEYSDDDYGYSGEIVPAANKNKGDKESTRA